MDELNNPEHLRSAPVVPASMGSNPVSTVAATAPSLAREQAVVRKDPSLTPSPAFNVGSSPGLRPSSVIAPSNGNAAPAGTVIDPGTQGQEFSFSFDQPTIVEKKA